MIKINIARLLFCDSQLREIPVCRVHGGEAQQNGRIAAYRSSRRTPASLARKGPGPGDDYRKGRHQPRLLRNPENSLSFVELDRLLMGCVAATKCRHFGLLVGQRSATLNPPPRPCLANCCHQFIRTSRLNCRIKPLTS
ncbi:hypothetical protein [Bradyrhizobium viridifuturi]|uniref:hypothetical protein n=1 Tax=Bradyrhizobium viridifuturi TaxID=1654716 RepID=UPI000FE1456D|nr:hypothetical protein [Bradyrhizobium viridifuturi]